MRGRNRKPVHIGGGDRSGGDHFRASALAVSHVRLADFLADRDHDALPSDHGAQSERDRDRDLDPQRNEFGRVVERSLVGRQLCDLVLAEVVLLVLQQEAERFRREIHVVAGIADRRGRNPRERAVFGDLLRDILDQNG